MSSHYYDVHEKKIIQNNNQNINNDKQEELKMEEKEKQMREEIEKLKELKRKEFLMQKEIDENKRQEKIKKMKCYYECYIDKKVFKSENEYLEHFKKYHKNDFPFYCEICNEGFYSYKSINAHYRDKGH